MPMIHKALPCLLALSVLAVSACGGGSVKDKLGLSKTSPDEFAVVKRAPLEMPPDYALRPPRPGAARPQEQATADQAKQAVFGQQAAGSAAPKSDAESSFLRQAGVDQADPSIRGRIDYEAKEVEEANKPVMKKLMGGSADTPSATVVDAKAEAERLRKNKEEGKPATAGETPSIEE